MKEIGWSFGMQSRAASRVGANPDIEKLADATLKFGIKECIVFGKDHTGFCFYPTKIGVPHPKLQIDLTGQMTKALHSRGIRVLSYLNFGMDGESGRKHHEWLHQASPGKTLLTADHYANICPFSPYTEEFLLPMLREILELYHVDGFFLDTMSAFIVCYCQYCRAEFQKTYNREIPVEPDDSGWEIYGPYHKQRSEALMSKTRKYIASLSPDAMVLFNHMGGPLCPIKTPGIVSCDPFAGFPWISFCANLLSAGPESGDVFIDRFQRGWGDRGSLTDLTLEYKSASIFAHNQRFFVGDRLHPEARFAPGSLRTMKKIGKIWEKMNRLMPPTNTAPDPDILVLYADENMFGRANKFFGASQFNPRWWEPTIGAKHYILLMDTGCNFLQTPEMYLKSWLTQGRLLILPEMQYLGAETDLLIRRFIADGGNVLVTGIVPRLKDNSIPDWLGIDKAEDSIYQSCVYLPDWKTRKDDERTLVCGNVRRFFPGSAKALLYGFSQYDLTLMGGGVNSSAAEADPHPLLTVNRYGKGKAFYLNAPLFSDYPANQEQLRIWFKTLIGKIFPVPKYSLGSKSGCVELVSYTAQKTSWHVLVNHGGIRTPLDVRYQTVVAPQPQFQVTLQIRSNLPMKSVKINGADTEIQDKNGIISIPVRMDSVWKIVKTES